MKRFQLTLLIVLLLAGVSTAQDQLENPGFELWDTIQASETDTIWEPVEWSSLKTSDNPGLNALAPVVCNRSSDAHSGEYSVKLTNVLSFVVANGVVSNGLFHPDVNPVLAYIFTDTLNSEWNTPLTARPDSISGWFKYTPQGGDTLQVIVNLHQGFGKQPDIAFTQNWIAVAEFKSPLNTEDEWVRFSVPFTYFSEDSPEYVLVVLNSGSGYTPVAGSIALFDDLEMIYNSPQSLEDKIRQSEGFIYALDKQHLMIREMDHSQFQTVRIHDLSGKLVFEGSVTSDQVNISSAHLREGIYIVTLNGKENVFSQKIMLH